MCLHRLPKVARRPHQAFAWRPNRNWAFVLPSTALYPANVFFVTAKTAMAVSRIKSLRSCVCMGRTSINSLLSLSTCFLVAGRDARCADPSGRVEVPRSGSSSVGAVPSPTYQVAPASGTGIGRRSPNTQVLWQCLCSTSATTAAVGYAGDKSTAPLGRRLDPGRCDKIGIAFTSDFVTALTRDATQGMVSGLVQSNFDVRLSTHKIGAI